MEYIVLDFETFYDPENGYSLREQSGPEYIGDERFKVHCLGLEYKGRKRILWGDEAIRKWLEPWRNYKGEYTFVAHNAYFDFSILAWYYKFVPARMLCTLLMANHVLGSAREQGKQGSNSVASLAERLGLEAKGRLDFMKGVRDPDEEQRAMLEVYLNGDLRLGRSILDTLMPHLSNAEQELWLIDHTLRIYTSKPLILNLDTVDRAERLIEQRRTTAIDRLLACSGDHFTRDTIQARIMSKQFERDLIDTLKLYGQPLPTKVRKITQHERARFAKLQGGDDREKFLTYADRLRREGADITEWGDKLILGETKRVPAMAKKDEDFIKLSFSPFRGIAALVNARLTERSAITSAARLTKMRKVARGLGLMPVHLVYYGGHTGRWAGGGGFNFQNLTNPDREKDPGKKAIASAIREAFEAPPGYVFVSADAAQIERRVSAWIAGDWGILDRFRDGVDVYSAFISSVLDDDIHKPTGMESEERQSYLKLMRHIGKEAELGLGFSMGWRKFVARLREDPDVARMFTTGDLSEDFCRDVVKKWRDKNPETVQCWEDLNNALFKALEGGVGEVGPVQFRRGKPVGSKLPVIDVCLPNGRVIYYRNIRRERAEGEREAWQKDHEWKHGAGQRLYGGLILENVTQAISRDIIVKTIVEMERDGFPVGLHVHDSVVGLSPEGEAEARLAQMIKSLSTNPSWAGKRLVLGAEGKIGRTLVT